MAKCEILLRSVNRRPSQVRDGPILLCFGDGEEGEPGQADRKRRQAGESAQLHPDLGGAGRGGSRALSRPHVSAPRVPLARGSPTRNPGTRGPALSASHQSTAGAPPLSRPSPGPGLGSEREMGGDYRGEGKREHALPGRPGDGAHYVTRPGGNDQ